MSRIMQKEIKSEMNDFFFAKDHLDFYHEYVNVEHFTRIYGAATTL